MATSLAVARPILKHPTHTQIILSSSGLVFVVAGLLLLSPLILVLFEPAQIRFARPYLICGLPTASAGALLWLAFRPQHWEISLPDGMIIVVVTWIVVCVVSAYPVMAATGLGFTQGVFEAVSGWTTTGLSVVNVAKAPKILLLWRSIMQLAGGEGLAIVMLAAFSLPVGAGLYRAEGKGDQLVPNVIRSSKIVVLLYSAYAVFGISAYLIAGMSPFDAVNQTFAAISTGGFSTRSESIGYWHSPSIEAITIVLMIAGNLNFATVYLLVRGKIKAFFLNAEIRVMAVLLLTATPIVLLFVTESVFPTFSKALRVAVFQTVSALTTTGFQTVTYNNWSAGGWLILTVLMIVGGGACSTAGGIKQYRIYLLWRSLKWEIRRLTLPHRVVHEDRVWMGEFPTFPPDTEFLRAGTFSFVYLLFLSAGTILMTLYGIPLKSALFEFASTIGTVGLSVGVTSPTLPLPVLWAQIAGMLFGRLEFFVVFGAFAALIRRLLGR